MSIVHYNSAENEYVIKIILLGDSSTGKSSLVSRLCDDLFEEAGKPTIGVDFKVKVYPISDDDNNNIKLKLQLWDTAGQEKYRAITASYYRNIVGVILVYDIGNEKSFDNIKEWNRQISDKVTDQMVKILVAHKIDNISEAKITKERGKKLAVLLGAEFMEASSKDNKGVYELFNKLSNDIYKEVILPGIKNGKWGPNMFSNGQNEQDIKINEALNNSKSKRCYC